MQNSCWTQAEARAWTSPLHLHTMGLQLLPIWGWRALPRTLSPGLFPCLLTSKASSGSRKWQKLFQILIDTFEITMITSVDEMNWKMGWKDENSQGFVFKKCVLLEEGIGSRLSCAAVPDCSWRYTRRKETCTTHMQSPSFAPFCMKKLRCCPRSDVRIVWHMWLPGQRGKIKSSY